MNSNQLLRRFVHDLGRQLEAESLKIADRATGSAKQEESFLVAVGERRGLKSAKAIAEGMLAGHLDPGDQNDELEEMGE